MSQAQSDQNLLFGVVALQMDFIGRDALVRGMNAWLLEKAKPLGQILVEQGALEADARGLLDALVRKHLDRHGGDAERSLAALGPNALAADALKDVRDPDLHQSIARIGRAAPQPAAPAASRPRFRILRPHAQEARGQVSVALDEELNREVAVKELDERLAGDPDRRARFFREARVAGGLEHPGIVPVYSLGTYADGRPFYAMRFIKGDSLQDAAARFHAGKAAGAAGAVEFRKLLKRFVDVCNTMAYAHDRGVLHRDLRPGNVLLGPYGETLVIDWGLARSLNRGEGGPAAADGVEPTVMGAAVGTPAFMSPEQAAGRLDQLGPATDVYGLGAVLYCVLTGKPPFDDGDAAAVLRKVERGEFTPPEQVNRRAPAALAAVCRKAMARDPAARYPTPRAMTADVEHWLADEPTSAYREPWLTRLGRWLRRHQVKAAAAGVMLATAAVVLGVAFALTERARAAEAALRVQEEQARADADRRAAGEKQAHDQADTERANTLRSLLDDYRGSADADLAAARLEWDAVAGQDRQRAALRPDRPGRPPGRAGRGRPARPGRRRGRAGPDGGGGVAAPPSEPAHRGRPLAHPHGRRPRAHDGIAVQRPGRRERRRQPGRRLRGVDQPRRGGRQPGAHRRRRVEPPGVSARRAGIPRSGDDKPPALPGAAPRRAGPGRPGAGVDRARRRCGDAAADAGGGGGMEAAHG